MLWAACPITYIGVQSFLISPIVILLRLVIGLLLVKLLLDLGLFL